jgi:hypothetical protein
LEKNMEISHLGREVKTALELAIAALAPIELVERLALAAGFLDAIVQFPLDSAPSLALLPQGIEADRADARGLAELATGARPAGVSVNDHRRQVGAIGQRSLPGYVQECAPWPTAHAR